MAGRSSGQDATGDRQPRRKVCSGLAYHPLPQAACPGNRSVMASPTHALERRSRKGSHWTVRPREGGQWIFPEPVGLWLRARTAGKVSLLSLSAQLKLTSPSPTRSLGQRWAEGPSSPHGRGVQTRDTSSQATTDRSSEAWEGNDCVQHSPPQLKTSRCLKNWGLTFSPRAVPGLR